MYVDDSARAGVKVSVNRQLSERVHRHFAERFTVRVIVPVNRVDLRFPCRNQLNESLFLKLSHDGGVNRFRPLLTIFNLKQDRRVTPNQVAAVCAFNLLPAALQELVDSLIPRCLLRCVLCLVAFINIWVVFPAPIKHARHGSAGNSITPVRPVKVIKREV